MWDSDSAVWAFGHSAIDGEGVYWRGMLVSGETRELIRDRAGVRAALMQMGEEPPGAVYCVGASSFALTLPDERVDWLEQVVDLELVLKAISRSQASMREKQGRSVRSVLARILYYVGAEELALAEREELIDGRGAGAQLVTRQLRLALEGLVRFLRDAADKNGELERIQGYEIPSSRILYGQAREVIRLDGRGASRELENELPRLERLRNKIYLASECDPEDLAASFSARAKLLRANQVEITEHAYGATFQQFLELAALSGRASLSDVAEYWRLRRQVRALQSVVPYGGEGGNPEFDVIGTRTSRILMRSPHIQWLAKRDRGQVRAQTGFSLIYVDYQSFEPAILAILSSDRELATACQRGLYRSIAEWMDVPVTDASVKFFKLFFLCFLYGRSRDRLADDLAEFRQEELEVAVGRMQRLEDRIPEAMKFKARVEAEARESGLARTHVGNFRRLEKERSYVALSHYLQGTGALIFKAALVRAADAVPGMHLIAPMHDGILAEVPSEARDAASALVAEAMQAAAIDVLGVAIPAVESTWSE